MKCYCHTSLFSSSLSCLAVRTVLLRDVFQQSCFALQYCFYIRVVFVLSPRVRNKILRGVERETNESIARPIVWLDSTQHRVRENHFSFAIGKGLRFKDEIAQDACSSSLIRKICLFRLMLCVRELSRSPTPSEAPDIRCSYGVMERFRGCPQLLLPRKTQLCKFFAVGACTRGSSCTFAHGSGQLRN